MILRPLLTLHSLQGVSKLGSGPGGSYGGVLPHLIMQGLPAGYTGTSTYALLPFYTPEAVKGILRGNKAIENYDLDRPASDRTIVPITTQAGCKAVFEDRENFRVMYQHAVRYVFGWLATIIPDFRTPMPSLHALACVL